MARKTSQDAVLAEVGMKPDKVPGTACRVFNLVTGTSLAEELPGWQAVAGFASSMYAGGMNDNSQVTFAGFAEMLRKAFARAESPGRELRPWADLPAVARAAWEAVARHLGNLFNCERDFVSNLARHEKRMAEFARRGFRN